MKVENTLPKLVTKCCNFANNITANIYSTVTKTVALPISVKDAPKLRYGKYCDFSIYKLFNAKCVNMAYVYHQTLFCNETDFPHLESMCIDPASCTVEFYSKEKYKDGRIKIDFCILKFYLDGLDISRDLKEITGANTMPSTQLDIIEKFIYQKMQKKHNDYSDYSFEESED